jgi:sterol desaturase/sphingolipid hydroxylase (fatty acid hydroxylase superfamily)
MHPALRAEQRRRTYANLMLLAALAAACSALAARGWLQVRLETPGPGRLAIEVVGLVVAFDAYFYALHRLLHTRWLMRRVHLVHHRAREVDVWSTIAMHPLELLLVAGFVPAATWLVPLHLASVAAAGTFLATSIVLGHTGWERLPGWWERTPLAPLLLPPRVHAAHHARLRCNYGATLTCFDRMFGTFRPA